MNKNLVNLLVAITCISNLPLITSAFDEEPPHKKRRIATQQKPSPHQRSQPLAPIFNQDESDGSEDELDQAFTKMLFGEENALPEFISAIEHAKTTEDKKDALMSLFSQKDLKEFSLQELERVIKIVKTLPAKEMRELFYFIENEFGERFTYDFVTQYTITSEYETNSTVDNDLTQAITTLCCPEPDETALMAQQRCFLLKSLLKGFTTAPRCVLNESEHKKYFELISQLDPSEQHKLAFSIIAHISSFITDLTPDDEQIESQHYSLEVFYKYLRNLAETNSALLESWLKREKIKYFFEDVTQFYAKPMRSALLEIIGPNIPPSGCSAKAIRKFFKELQLTKKKLIKKGQKYQTLANIVTTKQKCKQAHQKNLFFILQNEPKLNDVEFCFSTTNTAASLWEHAQPHRSSNTKITFEDVTPVK